MTSELSLEIELTSTDPAWGRRFQPIRPVELPLPGTHGGFE
jgi:hypothetical protein